ncbi:DUF1499 domain-containing protein [Marinomonas sp. M1K-6]|uniref:DUF1499 domain-containing protein n=1 Tax=Marinomonas profundi TaxID=2726122 RepID=A0A847R3P5_9GAMM|nr:DUF1499 domain-containing protein [Marinomonas profundi]NLQ16586.1 DUF1499 domain-containing protein [Marinomonas profundi]UDV03829.1 DUF1499 domain-containing protein [Marinomonas profundi]
MGRWIIALIVVFFVGFFIYVSMSNKSPEGLGITDGLLKSCPSSPNCVSTQAQSDDVAHYIEPIIYRGDRKETQLLIESSILAKGNTRIISRYLGYVHFEVKSHLVGFIDDVEFYLPEADSVIHIRSASRVGYSDFGVNRERVRQYRDLLVD